MQAILVTGGAGYIGSHVAKLLAREGFLPVVLDNLSTGNRWAVKWGPLIEGNIGDTDLVSRTARKYDVQAVIHLAASAYVGESVVNPRKYYRNNVVGSLALFDGLLEAGIDKIVFSSSCAVYGDSLRPVIDETHTLQPVNPYGETKLFVERVLHGLGVAHGLKSVCLRYFNASGADPEGEIGESHDPETHLVPIVVQAALGINQGVSVFGTDYATDDGSAVRDYTHVADLARAHVLGLRYLFSGGGNVASNLGTGRGHSVLDVIRAVERVSGRHVPKTCKSRRPGDPHLLVADATAAYETFGWRPEHTDLNMIVEHAWRWHVAQATTQKARATTV